jgi:hypothetical protein
MNEFIVWDKYEEKFLNEENIAINGVGTLFEACLDEDVYNLFEKQDRFTVHEYIGKGDIKDRKIYADCSIVEFEIFLIMPDDTIKTQYKLNGIFTFNVDELRYEIDILNHSSFVCLNYNIGNMRNFKIIDTIQENKLGLIKE